ncbi:MAG TPA: tryptophan synthase subunit alpha, partial [Xanthomonadaceae bacterium]|nr:tryptophan synthase subunit alpha [Xanthomonadaceae bacterium]
MNRLDTRFAQLAASGRTGLIPFVTAGDPDPAQMVALMHALVAGGADVIELGVPYSDPMADGPVIQRSSERAVARGVGLRQVLDWVRAFRGEDPSTPVVLMGYLNPLELYGLQAFATDAATAGVDGLLLVDCPVEEAEPFSEAFEAAGMHQIHLAAPTTADARPRGADACFVPSTGRFPLPFGMWPPTFARRSPCPVRPQGCSPAPHRPVPIPSAIWPWS